MGWTYGPERNASEVREHLRKQLRESGYAIVRDASTAYGRRYWAVLEKNGERDIFHALISGTRSSDWYGGDPSWGYKDMSESMGPSDEDCPLALLDLAPLPACEIEEDGYGGRCKNGHGYAHEWRDRVRKYHASRQSARAADFAIGQTFTLYGRAYEVCGYKGRSVLASGPRNGVRYKIGPAQLAQATRVT